ATGPAGASRPRGGTQRRRGTARPAARGPGAPPSPRDVEARPGRGGAHRVGSRAMPSAPVHVAVTGAAGQIGYALVHRIAAGELLGHEQPVVLRLLEIEPAMPALEGVVMELEAGAHPLP